MILIVRRRCHMGLLKSVMFGWFEVDRAFEGAVDGEIEG